MGVLYSVYYFKVETNNACIYFGILQVSVSSAGQLIIWYVYQLQMKIQYYISILDQSLDFTLWTPNEFLNIHS